MAIVNYGIIGLIQLELGYAETDDMTEARALELYDQYAKQALELMLAKNHDYDEAWRSMRISSYTDLILMKIYRTKQIEGHDGATLVSEGIDANYMDMINYSVFGLIKLEFESKRLHSIIGIWTNACRFFGNCIYIFRFCQGGRSGWVLNIKFRIIWRFSVGLLVGACLSSVSGIGIAGNG